MIIPTISRYLLGADLVIGLLFSATGAAEARDLQYARPAMACEALAGTTISAAGEAPARILSSMVVFSGPSPYCEVKGYVAPQVRFELRLPTMNWTQRLLFTGCGGFCGQARISPAAADQCQPVVNGEFAVVSSDLGHASPIGDDTVWAAGNPQGRTDFGHRGTHVVTVVAKQIIDKYYGKSARYAYFSGCSDGGREGLMEAQRYPDDFDGIVVGAPVLEVTTNNSLFHAWIVQKLLRRDGSKVLSDDDLAFVHAAALAACGPVGGGSDAFIADPRQCRFDPATLSAATDGKAPRLSPEQIEAVRETYAGAHDAQGRSLYPGLPVGSELNWNAQASGSKDFAASFMTYLAGDPSEPTDVWSVAFSQKTRDHYGRSGAILNAVDPNLRPFQAAGGKLLMWHGWADTGVPPTRTIEYYDAVKKASGQRLVDDAVRLYMLPGVYHCGGGQGPDRIDLLTPLMAWVEDGIAPNTVSVTKRVFGRTSATETLAPFGTR